MAQRTFKFIRGQGEILMNLKRYKNLTPEGVSKGLIAAGMFLQAESQRQVPVEYGILRASAYTRPIKTRGSTTVVVGYGAKYALFVHEAPGVLRGKRRYGKRADGRPRKGHYWDPQGIAEPKFLERVVKNVKVRSIMRDIVKIAAKRHFIALRQKGTK